MTSADGAAIRDIIKVAGRRDSSVKIRLYPVKVQGKEAPPEIAAGIHFMNRHNLCDVLIVGRGGGSMEDLWAFNDEKVVRAIAASRIPIILPLVMKSILLSLILRPIKGLQRRPRRLNLPCLTAVRTLRPTKN